METQKITWRALEYKIKERTVDWYWAVGLIAILIAVISIFMDNILFAVFIIIASITLLAYTARKPMVIEFEVNKRGLRMGNDFIQYSSLEAFWIDFGEKENKLIIKSKRNVMPLIVIPISEIDTDDLHTFLLGKLTEKEMEEPFSQKLMDVLGF